MKKVMLIFCLILISFCVSSCKDKEANEQTELVVPETFYDELPNVIRFEDFANTTKRTTYIDEEGKTKEYNGFGLVAYFFYSPFCSICKKPEFEEAVKKASETVGFYVIDLYADRELMENSLGSDSKYISEFGTQAGPTLTFAYFEKDEQGNFEKDGLIGETYYGYNTLEVLNKFTNYKWI